MTMLAIEKVNFCMYFGKLFLARNATIGLEKQGAANKIQKRIK